jgi:hypothetical protein
VDRREHVVLDEPLGEDDGVLEVVALPAHEGHEQVLAERELAVVGRRAVGQHVAPLDLVAESTIGFWWISVPWLERMNLTSVVLVDVALADSTTMRRRRRRTPCRRSLGEHDVAGVDGGAELHAGADERRLGGQQRHGLALHVRAHQGAVGVVVLEERDQRRGDRDDLRGETSM